MRFTEDSVSIPSRVENQADALAPARRRMNTADRKRQILDRAIQFFAKYGD